MSNRKLSAHIYFSENSDLWRNCTFALSTKLRSSGALLIVKIFAVELYKKDWSEIIMPDGKTRQGGSVYPRIDLISGSYCRKLF